MTDLFLADAHRSNCGSGLAREGGLITDLSLQMYTDQNVGAGLPAMAA
ncbi:hypothetical protein [Pseudomonas lini]